MQGTNASEDVTITDEKDPETASQTGSLASERGIDIGRVGSWATDFEKLLTDPIGLRTFAVSLITTSSVGPPINNVDKQGGGRWGHPNVNDTIYKHIRRAKIFKIMST